MIKNIVLDFGHGGLDAAGNYTTAPAKMFKFEDGKVAFEGVLNRQIGGNLEQILNKSSNYNIICTVEKDDPTDLSLEDRVSIVNSYKTNDTIFISIHCNAGGGNGFEIFTTRGNTNSDDLAETIATCVEGLYNRVGLKLRYDHSDGDKDKEADFHVLKKTKGVAVLVECGFFDNKYDFKLLSDSNFQWALSTQLAEGILSYINKQNE